VALRVDDAKRQVGVVDLTDEESANPDQSEGIHSGGAKQLVLSEGLISVLILALWLSWEAKTNKTAKFGSRRRRNLARTSSRWRRLPVGELLPSRLLLRVLPIPGAARDSRVAAEPPL
jgi:hypothetical protein